MILKKLTLVAGCALFALSAFAAETDSVDRGPFFSGTIRAKIPANNVTAKGIVVMLNAETNAFICYDTDLMRVSLAWTGGYLKFGNYMKEISHPQPPEVAGAPEFGTNPSPGWSAGDGVYDDPRPNKQGPLPAKWAKYRGLYLHGRQVVLSYTAGDTPVLELPGVEQHGSRTVFTRTFHVGKSGKPLAVLLCDQPGASRLAAHGRTATFADEQGRGVIAAMLDAPGDSSWLARPGGFWLTLPPLKKAATFKVFIAQGGEKDVEEFSKRISGPANLPDLVKLTKGGPALWKEPVVTQGALATSGGDGAYVVDTISENLTNRWGTRAFFGGFDFFPDGRAAVCTFHGDVWIVSGLDANLDKLTWRRFATGIFQGLGLKIVDGKVYVLGRDQITRLHDLNNDGEADFYECFNNDTVVTPNYHEFCLDLHTDSKGNFYFFKGSPWSPDVSSPHQGTCLKVSKDGRRMEVFATGFRAPNGSAIGPHGEITVSDNEGHWMPAGKLSLVRQGGFYGMMPAAQRELTFTRGGTNLVLNPSDPAARSAHKVRAFDGNAPLPASYDQPICWFPKNIDNSGGGQVWTGEKWGPLKSHLLYMSYGKGTLLHVMQEEVDGVTQAAVVKFPLKFGTGIMRGRVNPRDGQVYLCGVRGWQTDGQKDGGFYRVRYTGKPANTPVEFRTLKDGVKIIFSDKLDSASASDVANYAVEEWNYLYSGNYGSPDFSVTDPTQRKHDKLEVKSAALAPDGKTLWLEIADLRPANQVKIKLNLKSADGAAVAQEIYGTIHKLGSSSVAARK